MTPNSEALFRSMNDKKVLVIGDIMIDAYLSGTVDRISPEAPVPVVSLKERVNRPGGAANVAVNLHALGAKAFLCAVTGNDTGRNELVELLKQHSINTDNILADDSRPTTRKFRIIGNKNHMLRVDEEVTQPLSEEMEQQIINRIDTFINTQHPDLVILQDYNKGVLTPKIIRHTIGRCYEKHIVSAVDPKKHYFDAYGKCTIFKPNLKEFTEGININTDPNDISGLTQRIKNFQVKHDIHMMMVTLSERGVIYSELQEDMTCKSGHYNAELREISDVSGAGDTVISVAALALASGSDAATATQLANLAGGLVCEFSGVVPVNKKALFKEFERYLAANSTDEK